MAESYFLSFYVCLSTNASSSFSELVSSLFIIGIMLCIGWLNSSVAGPGSPGSSGVALICNKDTCISALVLIHFIVCFMKFIHTSTCPLLWWLYDDYIACSMFIHLQNCLKLPEIKLPPTSDIIFFGKPYSEKNNFAC